MGRTLALRLAQQGLRVALTAPELGVASQRTAPLQSSPEPADVRAYALNQASRTLLESVRCWPSEKEASAVLCMQVHGDEQGHLCFSAQEQGVSALNWIVDVSALQAQLVQSVQFQPRIALFDTPQAAALSVICEGKASRTRQEFGVEFDVTNYEQSALAARVQCAQGHAQVAYQWFGKDEILAFLPLGGAAGNTYAIVWSTTPERAQALQTMDADDFCQALALASHETLGLPTLCSERATWPLQQAQARRWSGSNAQGAWVLAGDAAHNVHPLSGQGLNLGLGDVSALAQVLAERPYWRSPGDMRLLRAYERARKAELATIGRGTDALQMLFMHPHPVVQALRNWGMNQFNRSGLLKQWVTQRAMGRVHAPHPSTFAPAEQRT